MVDSRMQRTRICIRLQVRRTGLLNWRSTELSGPELSLLTWSARVVVVNPAPAVEVSSRLWFSIRYHNPTGRTKGDMLRDLPSFNTIF